MTFSCVPAWTRYAPLMSALTLLVSTAVASAQVKIPQAALDSPTELSQVYHEGSLMEESGRWGEALSLYEKASRKFPQDQRLKSELSEARLHFDVRRRYADSSFVRMAKNGSLRDSLEIYQEILLKIKTFHVDQPDWKGLVRRGSEAFLITIASDEFTKQFDVTLDDFARQRIQDYLTQETLSKRIIDRNTAQLAVHDFAIMMHEAHGIPAQVVVLEFATGATTALDWYSSFLTTDQYSEVMSQIDGNFVGLGV